MLKVGSTVNHLSQNCTAAKPFIVEFAQRMAGIGSTAKMTIPEIMAFAATLDAHGQKVEMSATALQRTIMELFKKPGEDVYKRQERHAADAALSAASPEETVRIRAVGGKIADRRRQTRNAIAGYSRLDTVAYRHASATSRAEHTATTSVAEPPDTTRIILTLATLILIVPGIALYLRRRK